MIRIFALTLPALLLSGCFSQQPVPAVDRNTSSQAHAAPAAAAPAALTGPGYYTVKRGDTLYRIALENGQDYKDIAAWNNLTNPSTIKEGQVLRVAPPGSADTSGGAVTQAIIAGTVVESRSLDQPAPTAAVAPTASAAPANGIVKREPRVGKEPYSDEAYARLSKAGDAPKHAETRVETRPEAAAPSSQSAPSSISTTAPAPVNGPDDVPWLWPSPAKVVTPYNESANKGLDFAGKAGDSVLAAGDGKVVYAGSGLRGYGELIIVKHNGIFLSAYAHNRKILVREGQVVSRGQKIAEMGSTDTDTVKLHFEIRKQGKPVDPAQYLPKR